MKNILFVCVTWVESFDVYGGGETPSLKERYFVVTLGILSIEIGKDINTIVVEFGSTKSKRQLNTISPDVRKLNSFLVGWGGGGYPLFSLSGPTTKKNKNFNVCLT